jgi:alkylhydroperoxidase family enzyme
VDRVLAHDPDAPIDERVRATLALLEKMTKTPQALTPDDMRTVMRAGVSKAAIEEALDVAFLFNIYDRLADAMGWDVPALDSGAYTAGAKRLLSRGYR